MKTLQKVFTGEESSRIIERFKMYRTTFTITKLWMDSVSDMHLEIVVDQRWNNISQSFYAVFGLKEQWMFNLSQEIQAVFLTRKFVHEFRSSKKTKFMFEIWKNDLSWMFGNIEFLENPHVGICLIPADEFEWMMKEVEEENEQILKEQNSQEVKVDETQTIENGAESKEEITEIQEVQPLETVVEESVEPEEIIEEAQQSEQKIIEENKPVSKPQYTDDFDIPF